MSLIESRILHLHVPKTAGTALKSALTKNTDRKLRVFPHYDERMFENVVPEDYDLYSGHFGFKTASRIGGSIITVLRNPFDRFLSIYYFSRQLYESGNRATRRTAIAGKYSLDQFVQIKDEPWLLEEYHNQMTWQIAHGSSIQARQEMRNLGKTEDEIFGMAVANLAQFAVVGIQERMQDFSAKLSEQLGISLEIDKVNVTRKRREVAEISIATRKRMYDWIYMDLELYFHALKAAGAP